jgi:hypothetical protein
MIYISRGEIQKPRCKGHLVCHCSETAIWGWNPFSNWMPIIYIWCIETKFYHRYFWTKRQLPYPRWCEKIYLASVQWGTNYLQPASHICSQLFWSQENKTQINLLCQVPSNNTVLEFIPLWICLPQPSVNSIKINVNIVIVILAPRAHFD